MVSEMLPRLADSAGRSVAAVGASGASEVGSAAAGDSSPGPADEGSSRAASGCASLLTSASLPWSSGPSSRPGGPASDLVTPGLVTPGLVRPAWSRAASSRPGSSCPDRRQRWPHRARARRARRVRPSASQLAGPLLARTRHGRAHRAGPASRPDPSSASRSARRPVLRPGPRSSRPSASWPVSVAASAAPAASSRSGSPIRGPPFRVSLDRPRAGGVSRDAR